MDNFTHSLAGWVVGQTGLKAKSRKGLAALILGANMPDIDIFLGWVPWMPMATHRGFTHGLVGGVLVMPPLLAGLLWLLDRCQVLRGSMFKSGLPMRFGWLVALSYIGAITHPLLDLQTSYAVQLFSPFSSVWWHADTLFIIDVWLWSGVSFAIWLSRRRERDGGSWQRPAQIAVLAWLAYLGIGSVITVQAKRTAVAALAPATPDLMIANEEPVWFWTRSLVYRVDGRIGRGLYSPFSGYRPDGVPTPDNMTDPIVRKAIARAPERTRQFLRWSIATQATVERRNCEAIVHLGDARFSGNRFTKSRFAHDITVPASGPACPQRASRP